MVTVYINVLLKRHGYIFRKKVKISREPVVGDFIQTNITPDGERPINILIEVTGAYPLADGGDDSFYSGSVGKETTRILLTSKNSPDWTVSQCKK